MVVCEQKCVGVRDEQISFLIGSGLTVRIK